jgi:glycosyltransferase involved in cell wall biosynthesis
MRVLYFVSAFEQGGAERQIAELIANLPRDRFEPHVAVCHVHDDFDYALAAPTFDLASPNGPEPKTFVSLVRALRRVRPAVVHAVHDPQNSYARLAVRVARVGAVVGSIVCTRLPARTIRRERITHRLGGALVVNSSGIRDELVARARIAQERIDVVENGVDAVRFRPLDEPARRAARERFEMRGITFVLPGRIAEQKNQVAVVNAVALLRARGEWPNDARVILAGRVAPYERYEERVDAAIRERGVGEFVRRIDAVRDAETLLAAADVVLMPSIYEGLPNAVLESLACATPALVSHASNVDSLVADGETGFVLDATDADGVAHAMMRAIRDRTALQKMGERGRERTINRFGIARMVDATCAIYERVAREAS